MRISDWSSDVCSSDLTIVGEAIDRSGMARGTLAVREGLVAPVPTLRKRPVATMKDMGMDMGMPDPTEGRPVDPTAAQHAAADIATVPSGAVAAETETGALPGMYQGSMAGLAHGSRSGMAG